MSKLIISGNPLPNMPWEDRPEGARSPLGLCSMHPLIPLVMLLPINIMLHSTSVPLGKAYTGVFTCKETIPHKVLPV